LIVGTDVTVLIEVGGLNEFVRVVGLLDSLTVLDSLLAKTLGAPGRTRCSQKARELVSTLSGFS
jgi:hypothetical protein